MNCLNALKAIVPALALALAMPGTLSAAAVRETAFVGDRAFLERFRYVRQARKVADDVEHAHYAIAVDGAFFETLKDRDELRITRPDGQSVPFLLRKLTHTAIRYTEEALSGKISITQTLPDGRYALDYELSGGAEDISGVELEFTAVPEASTLEIAVGDGRHWESALPETELAELAGNEFTNVRNFPFARPRHGRIVRLMFAGKLAQEESVTMPVTAVSARRTIFKEEADAPLLADSTLEKLEEQDSRERTAIIYHSDRTPLKEFRFDSDTANFQRRVIISGSDDRRRWTELAGGNIRRIGPDRALKVEIPESRWKFYRVEILNGRAKALLAPRVRTMALQYELLIDQAEAADNLVLYYGANEMAAPAPGEVTPPAPGESIGTYELLSPVLNPLHRYSVSEVTTYRFLGGGVILCGTLWALFYVFKSLKRSETVFPRD